MDKYHKILGSSTIAFMIIFLLIIFMKPITFKIEITNGTKEEVPKTHNMDSCYLTIHNFVSLNKFDEYRNINEIIKFKTFIYSYTKPFLLELINNATTDCICCP